MSTRSKSQKGEGGIDPVCSMSVDADAAGGRTDYKGHTYYFCSRQCLSRFRSQPDKFLSR